MLTVLHNNTTTVANFSDEARSFSGNAFALELAATHHLYLGLQKPFERIYIGQGTANLTAGTLSAEYWDGSAWSSLGLTDKTNQLLNDGFLYWSKPSDWAATTLESLDRYYIRLIPTATFDVGTTVQGINLLLSEDIDLIEKYRGIEDYRRTDDSNFITFHQYAVNEIIQDLRNAGNVKFNSVGNRTDINVFDLHQPEQLREAAAWKALEGIFFEASNEVEDKADQLARSCRNKYQSSFKLYLLSLDTNDDGLEDSSERNDIHTIMVSRI